MIGRIAGTLLLKQPPAVLVDVQGVGYELDVPMSTFFSLPATGDSVALLVHMVVREDAMLLFGFATDTERALFRLLLKVNGVGAKVALAILSNMNGDEFLDCVAREDATALVRIPGIGKKTAERLVVELKDKARAISVSQTDAGTGSSTGGESARGLAEDALATLGYKPAEVKKLLDANADDSQSVEEMIRAALRGSSR